jgi:hypothetical protein
MEVYASTSRVWFDAVRSAGPFERVGFWRPRDVRAVKILTGDAWFFKEWGKPQLLGFGRFVAHERTSPRKLWEDFGPSSGARNEHELLLAIASARSPRDTDLDTEIGNAVLSDFTPFEQPVPLSEVGLDNLSVPFAYVPNNSRALTLVAPAPPRLVPEALPSLPPERQEMLKEVFMRDSAHVALLRQKYGGVCQVTGSRVLEGSTADLTQVHHIDFLCRGGADDPSNMICLSPNWHAIAHSSGVSFDWEKLEFVVGGKRHPLKVNRHLTARLRAS